MFSSAHYTVDDSPAVQVLAVNGKRQFAAISNATGSDPVALGPAGVTYATGFILHAGFQIPLDLSQFNRAAGSELYAICDTGETAEVSVLEYTAPSL